MSPVVVFGNRDFFRVVHLELHRIRLQTILVIPVFPDNRDRRTLPAAPLRREGDVFRDSERSAGLIVAACALVLVLGHPPALEIDARRARSVVDALRNGDWRALDNGIGLRIAFTQSRFRSNRAVL